MGIFVADMHPGHYIDEGTYALLGAASFLGGAMRLTVCTCVMLLELTNNLALLPLIMLVLLVAKVRRNSAPCRLYRQPEIMPSFN